MADGAPKEMDDADRDELVAQLDADLEAFIAEKAKNKTDEPMTQSMDELAEVGGCVVETGKKFRLDINEGFAQDFGKSSALAMDLPLSWAKPIYLLEYT